MGEDFDKTDKGKYVNQYDVLIENKNKLREEFKKETENLMSNELFFNTKEDFFNDYLELSEQVCFYNYVFLMDNRSRDWEMKMKSWMRNWRSLWVKVDFSIGFVVFVVRFFVRWGNLFFCFVFLLNYLTNIKGLGCTVSGLIGKFLTNQIWGNWKCNGDFN